MIPQTLIECFVYSSDICVLFISCYPHSLEMRIFGSLNVIPNFRIVPCQQILFCLQTLARQPPKSHFTSVVKPEVTQYHQEHLKACCAIEVSLNRLTFAKLRLDSTGPNRVLLEVWDSLPLKLPGGKEFRPQLCESVLPPVLPRVISTLFPNNSLDSDDHSLHSDIALIVCSLPLKKFALNRAGMLGYLLGRIQAANRELHPTHTTSLPIYTVDKRQRNKILSKWFPSVGESPSLDILLTQLPGLAPHPSVPPHLSSLLKSPDVDRTTQGSLFDHHEKTAMRRCHEASEVGEKRHGLPDLLIGFVLHQSIATYASAQARAALVHLDQNGVTPAYCETAALLFRPISFGQTPKARTTVADTIGYSHHALVLGFLCASLLPSSNPNTFAFPYIDEYSLSSWVGYRAEDWPRVVQEALQNYPDAYVRLTPPAKRPTPIGNHAEDILNVNLHFKSDTIMTTFDSPSTQHWDRVAVQFLLSRCLFSCLHYLFGRDHL
ncbi:hypothetical protein CSKR_103792 [Clonorchis sinensis]|uniref:Uncharacterized protein n=1 Tax=Clonorchis sinensis TaxID=79923 RepID=A0A3R7GIJ0_CLOSI|nr:hypothetical protein CSKR_103792 [Clonorchis sinensis]